jgi:hypothetical protein
MDTLVGFSECFFISLISYIVDFYKIAITIATNRKE